MQLIVTNIVTSFMKRSHVFSNVFNVKSYLCFHLKTKNDSFIKTAIGKNRYEVPLPRLSNQGNHLRPSKIDYGTMITHIQSFDPNISHHRREHAPKKKYLPYNLTITSMFDNFKWKLLLSLLIITGFHHTCQGMLQLQPEIRESLFFVRV